MVPCSLNSQLGIGVIAAGDLSQYFAGGGVDAGERGVALRFAHQYTAGFDATPPEYSKWSQQQRDEKARELLKEAGYGDGKPLVLLDCVRSLSTTVKISPTR